VALTLGRQAGQTTVSDIEFRTSLSLKLQF
jgi:hypothetical protein